MALIDLTRRLNADTAIYRDGDYSDPDLVIAPWCEITRAGFRVARLGMGTQTGTHIDAPAHFNPDGETLEALDVDHLIGPYFHVDPAQLAEPRARAARLGRHGGERILFIAAAPTGATLAPESLDAMLGLGVRVWVVAGPVTVAGTPPLHFHSVLAAQGVYLVEDLDPQAAARVPETGWIAALPLRLEGVSGSPCRVVLRAD